MIIRHSNKHPIDEIGESTRTSYTRERGDIATLARYIRQLEARYEAKIEELERRLGEKE